MSPTGHPITPTSTGKVVSKSPTPLGEKLKILLNPSDCQYTELLALLRHLGFTSFGDLAFLQEKDLALLLPPAMKRKLLLVAEFVQRGGKADDVEDMEQLTPLVFAARESQTPISVLSKTQTTKAEDEEVVELNVGG